MIFVSAIQLKTIKTVFVLLITLWSKSKESMLEYYFVKEAHPYEDVVLE